MAQATKRLAREKYPVSLIARGHTALDAMAAEIGETGGTAQDYASDVTDMGPLRAVLAEILAQTGALALLVWNGGRWVETPALALDPAEPETDLRLTTVAALVATQAVAPAMEAAGGGSVIVTGGGLALAPEYGGAVPALAAGKAAARALVHAAAPDPAERGIHLGTVTIAGQVAAEGPFAPDRIAEAFWAMHMEPCGDWTVERVFDGQA